MLYYERKLEKLGFDFIIGVDEAGRGPLAGPVVAAAARLNKRRFKNRIDDSKKLTALQRERAYQEIILNSVYGVGIIDEKIIDRSGILAATIQAMKFAVKELLAKITPRKHPRIHVIVDGNMALPLDHPSTSIIRGDGKSLSIASASIIAKVTRDRIMRDYHKTFPEYNFLRHKGYPTKEHVRLLKEYGPSPIHRLSFSYA
ncbi:MAG: ribonuclease HII [Candidatus Omnitrophica bacterium]|nr:ribonuclease HII [Candidatus Omnitrophota bacterium]MDD5237172.1 ribonuclease HII [Candidatus Omnitrophota bacterium]MDD5610887.1 ribonuclease HII [Candidatus Omnitrophota bacterium]